MSLLFGIGQQTVNLVRGVDTFVDKLHRKYTVFLLLFFVLIVSLRRLIGEPVHCWTTTTTSMTSQLNAFIEQECWLSPFHHTSLAQSVIRSDPEHGNSIVNLFVLSAFHLWIPSSLFLQAVLFLVPWVLWSIGNLKPGITVSLIEGVSDNLIRSKSREEKDDFMNVFCGILNRHLITNHRDVIKSHRFNHWASILYGYTLCILFLFVKSLYLINVSVQFIGVSVLLGARQRLPNVNTLKQQSLFFPRSIVCEVNITYGMHSSMMHSFRFPCNVPINVFHENVYTVMWWWFLILVIISFTGLGYWTFRILFKRGQVYFIQSLLVSGSHANTNARENASVAMFCCSYLRADGVLFMKLLQERVGDVTTAKVISRLFRIYENNLEEEMEERPEPFLL